MAGIEDQFDPENLNESVEELINAWRTEIHSPELLSFKTDLIDEMKSLLQAQQVRILFYSLKIDVYFNFRKLLIQLLEMNRKKITNISQQLYIKWI